MSLVGDGSRTGDQASSPAGNRTGGRPGTGGGVDSTLLAERLIALLCLAVAVVIGLRAESLVTQSSIARPGVLPAHGLLWLGAGVLGVASLVWVVQAFRRGTGVEVPDVGRFRDVLAVLAVLVVGAWSAQWLGLLLAAGATYIALLLYYRDQGRIFILLSAVGYLVFLHYGLEVLLTVPLPRSPILPLPF